MILHKYDIFIFKCINFIYFQHNKKNMILHKYDIFIFKCINLYIFKYNKKT